MSNVRKNPDLHFRTLYGNIDVPVTNPGNPVAVVLELRKKEDGSEYLEQVGTRDLQAEIDSHRDSCDLSRIVQRILKTGDYSELTKGANRGVVYGDTTDLPKSLQDVLNLGNKVRDFAAAKGVSVEQLLAALSTPPASSGTDAPAPEQKEVTTDGNDAE